jgi:hypothetical protein
VSSASGALTLAGKRYPPCCSQSAAASGRRCRGIEAVPSPKQNGLAATVAQRLLAPRDVRIELEGRFEVGLGLGRLAHLAIDFGAMVVSLGLMGPQGN